MSRPCEGRLKPHVDHSQQFSERGAGPPNVAILCKTVIKLLLILDVPDCATSVNKLLHIVNLRAVPPVSVLSAKHQECWECYLRGKIFRTV